MVNGLRCPECSSWYPIEPMVINSGIAVGEICGNQAMTAPHPEFCSPTHPCKGRLEPDGRIGTDVLQARAAINASFETIDDDDFDERFVSVRASN